MPGSGTCRPLGGTAGRGSRHIRATPRRDVVTVQEAMELLARDSPLPTDLPAGQPAFLETSVIRPHRHPSEPRRFGNGVGQNVAILFSDEVRGRLCSRRATISTHVGLQSLVPGPGGERCAYTAPPTAGAAALTGAGLLSSLLDLQMAARSCWLKPVSSTGLSQSSAP